MAKEISGLLTLNQYSTDSGSTWKTIVCEDTSNISGTSTVSTKKTKCGTFSSTSDDPIVITGSGVAGADLGADQASYQDIAILRKAQTTVLFRRQNSADPANGIVAGEVTYFLGEGKFNEATETSSAEESTAFNWSFTSSGDYELTSES